MPGPYAKHSIVLEVETGSSDRFLRFVPDRPQGDAWLHQLSEFDRRLDRMAVIDRYALPQNEEYEIHLVTVPAGERLCIGEVAGTAGRTGGGDLVEVMDRTSVPSSWIDGTTTLATLLE